MVRKARKTGDSGWGVIVQAKQVCDEALVEVDAGGGHGAAVEGLKDPVLEFTSDGLG